MKEKLELRHIAPYLPYGLRMKYDNNFISPSERLLDIENYNFLIGEAKPILRPLSDLTKEIEHNGTKINPIDWIEKNTYPEKYEHCAIMNNGIVEMGYYKEYQKLLEWHFDVFGLIEKGLAIDINTLECKHLNIKREDGLDECMDCGVRNY